MVIGMAEHMIPNTGQMMPMGVTRLFTDLHRNIVTNTHSQEEEDSVTQSRMGTDSGTQ